jgi:chromosome partitioning protein
MSTGARRSPKTIATINFKGGVGKTTVTWCLADLVSSFSNAKVLMFDLDAQMSLTQAIALNEATGKLYDKFGKWYEQSINKRKTIIDALDQFTKPAAARFDRRRFRFHLPVNLQPAFRSFR